MFHWRLWISVPHELLQEFPNHYYQELRLAVSQESLAHCSPGASARGFTGAFGSLFYRSFGSLVRRSFDSLSHSSIWLVILQELRQIVPQDLLTRCFTGVFARCSHRSSSHCSTGVFGSRLHKSFHRFFRIIISQEHRLGLGVHRIFGSLFYRSLWLIVSQELQIVVPQQFLTRGSIEASALYTTQTISCRTRTDPSPFLKA